MSRRAVLVGGLGVVAAAGAGALADVLPGGARLRGILGLNGPDGRIPDAPPGPVQVDRVRSAARGRDVDLIVMRPAGAPSDLPVCLALHGRGAGANSFLDLGVPHFLTAAAQEGTSPFAMVAVDGGDSYFVARNAGDDPLRMLLDEVPDWLDRLGLPAPAAGFGISMGAFGTLRLARETDLRAVAVVGPALFQTWSDAKRRDVFRDEQQWAANEPLRHTKDILPVPLGVWCGNDDPFASAAEELVERASPEVVAFGPGGHEENYFLRVMPEVLRFVGRRISRAA
ncbi:alpha/beta hydrolase [Actinophytocola oryzae]|uniref:alpha/beta hydrolase n=1 Tax=Actinophytocola oryzae TaxID=502181 RepID=UPI001FBB91B7|nr:esterase [Actinophytocola oryzae]